MRLDNTGKKIEAIEFLKKGVKILFDDTTSFLVDTSILSEFYLYKDKVIDLKTYHAVQKASEFLPFQQYLNNLLSKGRYSEATIRLKLKTRKALDSVIHELIFNAKKNLLIDDQALMTDLVEYYLTKNVGVRYIKKQLYLKGISKPLIEGLQLTLRNQEESAIFQLEKLTKKLESKPYAAKKEFVYRTLSAKGFEDDIIHKVLNRIDKNDDEKVNDQLTKVYQAALSKYQKKYKNWELQHRIFLYLKTKGYTSKDIKKLIGANQHDLD